MSDILIRGLDKKTVARLKQQAKRHGRSLQAEAKLALENAAGPSMDEFLASARVIRKKFGRRFHDSVELIQEDRKR